MKKERALCFVCDQNYLFLLGTVLENLRDKGIINEVDDIIIIYSGFSIDNILTIKIRYPSVVFIEYTYNDFLREILQSDSENFRNFIKRFSYMNMAKIKAFTLLEQYKTVILMDLDILIKDSIDELFSLDCDIAWRNGLRFSYIFQKNEKYRECCANEFTYIKEQKIKPNTGLIVINDTFDYKISYRDSIEALNNLIKIDFVLYPVDIAFAHIAYKNDLKIISLDATVYNAGPHVCNYNSKIIHFQGKVNRPWNNKYIPFMFIDWIKFYKRNPFKSDQVIDYSSEYCMLYKKIISISESVLKGKIKSFCYLLSYLIHGNLASLICTYSKNWMFAYISLSSNNRLHYEYFIAGDTVKTCLHFEGEYSDKYEAAIHQDYINKYEHHPFEFGYEICYTLDLDEDPLTVAQKMFELYSDTFPTLVNQGLVEEKYRQMLTPKSERIEV